MESYALYSRWVYYPLSPFYDIQIIGIVYSANLAPLASAKLYTPQNCFTGFALFWGGLTVGACNLLCGICVDTSGSPATLSDAADADLVVRIWWLKCLALFWDCSG